MSDLIQLYTERFNTTLKPAAEGLDGYLREIFDGNPLVCFLRTRAKKIDRFISKSEKLIDGEKKYTDPINEVQDQVGGLIVTRFLSDVETLKTCIEDDFTRIERLRHEPESEFEFGYMGTHYILHLPTEVTSEFDDYDGPDFFELQIKTLFQYAWSETNHAIGYERFDELSREQKRMTAYIAAQAWGADKALAELNSELEANAQLH